MNNNLIFDFDGVLVDSMDVWAGVYVKLLKEGTGVVPPDMVKEITPLGNVGSADYCITHGLNMSREQILEYSMNSFKHEYSLNVKAKEGVGDFLRRMKDSGKSLHVLTASSHSYVDICLKNNGIYDLFDNVWSVDDFGLTKAQPEIYVKVAALIHSPVNECTFFDDNYIALSTAKAAGMKTVGVYDRSSNDFVANMKMLADEYIYDFTKIY